ncbi:SpaA isopeptide-forming pilin-related protein [Paenarthrobacter histidinolovorans]|uniref:Surface anchored protein n=1 Tax=Paenarthrobacter histidinolovorans TaxID=43664 RepID=A0ABW8MZK0_9MICC
MKSPTIPDRHSLGRRLIVLAVTLFLFLGLVPPAQAAVIPGAITGVSTGSTSIATGDEVSFTGTWAVPDGSQPGDTFTMQLPDQLAWRGPATFELKNASGDVVAIATVDPSGLVTFTLTDFVLTHSNVSGSLFFQTQFTKEVTTTGPETLVFKFGETEFPITVESKPGCKENCTTFTPPTTPGSAFGWGDPNDTIAVASTLTPLLTSDSQTVVLTDTPGPGLEIDCSFVEAWVGPYDSTGHITDIRNSLYPPVIDCTPTQLTVTWQNVPAGNAFRIDLIMNVTDPNRVQYVNSGTQSVDGVPTNFTSRALGHRAGGTGDGTTGGISVKKVDSVNTSTVLSGAVFDVRNSAGTSVGTITTDATGKGSLAGLLYGDYTLVETTAPAGYTLDSTPHQVTVNDTSAATDLQITNTLTPPVTGGISVKKVDSVNTSTVLSGAVFDVRNSAGTSVGTITTDATGKGSLAGLLYGDYTLVETTAPAGYTLDSTPHQVTVNDTSAATDLQITNTLTPPVTGGISVKKVDSVNTSTVLSGAVFDVRNSAGTSVGTITTDATGKGSLAGLLYGDYTLVETTAPAGYTLDSTPHQVTVNDTSAATDLQITNTLTPPVTGGISVKKVDSVNTSTVLSGAVFDVRNSAGTSVGTITTDATGKGSLAGLLYGDYTLVETTAPAGYTLDSTPHQVTVNDTSAATDLQITNTLTPPVTGGISVKKVDSVNTSTVLSGAVFDVRNSAGTSVGTITTDATGKGSLAGLLYGDYTLVETTAPAGYTLDSTPHQVTVNDTSAATDLQITNTLTPPVTGGISVKKVDSVNTSTVLSGAVFDVRNSAGTSVGTITTDATGKGSLAGLLYGDYTLVETTAPAGYTLDSTPHQVTVNDTSAATDLQITNTLTPPVTGGISVKKVDSVNTSTVLSGAVFDVRNSAGTSVGTITTDATGKGSLAGLLYGDYTLVETTAPAGYTLDSTPHQVTVNDTSAATDLQITNTLTPPVTGGISVKKVDSVNTSTVLSGAVFDVRNSAGTSVGTITTDATGKGSLAGLPYGDYTLVETTAPAGYTLDSTPHQVTVNDTSAATDLQITNTLTPPVTGGISVKKVDSVNTSTVLSGAVFDVRNSAGTSVGTITTDATGKGSLAGLPYGDYTLVETTAPAGYTLDSTPHQVTVNDTSAATDLQITNTLTPPVTGGISVKKVDSVNTSTVLSGAVFDVRNSAGTSVGTITTDATGKGSLAGLPYGDYTLVETTAPAGYTLDSTPHQVTVNDTSAATDLQITNTLTPPVTGGISVKKVDSVNTSTVLSGAVFDVRNSAGTSVGTITTDATGKGSLAGLPYGDYTLVETTAPAGYTLDSTPHQVTVTDTSAATDLQITNTLTPPVTGAPATTSPATQQANPAPTSSTPAANPVQDVLAYTGANPLLPIAIGMVALLLGATMLIPAASKRRRRALLD